MGKTKSINVNDFEDLKKNYHTTVKAIEDLTTFMASDRPYTNYDLLTNERYSSIRSYGNHINLWDLYELSRFSDAVLTIHNAINKRVFKKGIDYEELFDGASQAQLEKAKSLIAKANSNGQSLVKVLEEAHKDVNWADDAFLLLLKDYVISMDNRIIGSDLKEIIRVFPLNVSRVIDDAGNLGYKNDGRKCYFELKNRSELVYTPTSKEGIPNLVAHYEITTNDGVKYYNSGEIINYQKFNPSIRGGFSPLFSVYNKAFTLVAMDWYVRQVYGSEKPSKKMVFLKSSNLESLEASITDYSDKVKKNPHGFYPMAVASKDGSPVAEVVDFMSSLDEMQFTQVRTDYRNAIGALYGVSPLFQNDVSVSGGLNNEGLQVTVTNDTVEADQDLYNSGALPRIFNIELGITDWRFFLPPNEEEDTAYLKDLMTKDLANAKLFLEMGGKVSYTKDGTFVFREVDFEKPEAGSFDPFSEQLVSDSVPEMELSKKKDNLGASLKKVKGVNPTAQKEFKSALEKELESVVRKIDIKRKPSEAELKAIVSDVSRNFDKRLKAKSANRIKAIYDKAVKSANRELGTKYKPTTEVDKNMIEALKRQPVFRKAFSDLSLKISKQLHEIITKAYSKPNFSIDNLVKDMKKELEASNAKLRTIARTESSKISISARKVSYEKTGNFNKMKFKHIGPSDDRTTVMSKKVKELTKNGVSWSEYVDIVARVAKEHNSKWEVDFDHPITHPNTRHTVVRVV